jgi:hypothetical protein
VLALVSGSGDTERRVGGGVLQILKTRMDDERGLRR